MDPEEFPIRVLALCLLLAISLGGVAIFSLGMMWILGRPTDSSGATRAQEAPFSLEVRNLERSEHTLSIRLETLR